MVYQQLYSNINSQIPKCADDLAGVCGGYRGAGWGDMSNVEGQISEIWVYIAIFVSDCAPSSLGDLWGLSPPNVNLTRENKAFGQNRNSGADN